MYVQHFKHLELTALAKQTNFFVDTFSHDGAQIDFFLIYYEETE